MFQRSPLGEAVVAAAEHADPAVAPGLRRDPVDHCGGVDTVVLERGDGIRAAPLAPAVRRDTDVAARRHRLGIAPIQRVIGVDGELQQGRQPRGLRRPYQHHRDAGAIRRGHQHVVVDDVAARIVLLQRGIEQRLERRIRRMHLPGAHQADGFRQRQALAPPGLLQRGVQAAAPARQAAAERKLGAQRHRVVQRTETLGEHLPPRLRVRQAARFLQRLCARMQFVLQEQRRLRRGIIAQRAQRLDALDGPRLLPGGNLQPEQRIEETRAIVVAIARNRIARQLRHGAVDAVALQAVGHAHVLRERGPREQGQQQPRQAAHRLTASAA